MARRRGLHVASSRWHGWQVGMLAISLSGEHAGGPHSLPRVPAHADIPHIQPRREHSQGGSPCLVYVLCPVLLPSFILSNIAPIRTPDALVYCPSSCMYRAQIRPSVPSPVRTQSSIAAMPQVDTVRAYHFGVSYLVEVAICLGTREPTREPRLRTCWVFRAPHRPEAPRSNLHMARCMQVFLARCRCFY